MTTIVKQIAFIAFLFLFSALGLQAQVALLQYRKVPQENISEFIHRETTYWAKVAEKAIEDGKLAGWSLWRRTGGFDLNDDDSYNFVFVNILNDVSDIDNMGSIWNASEALPDVRMEDMETWSLGEVAHSIVVRLRGQAGTGGKFARVNYAKVSDMQAYLEHETGTWQPFIDNLIKEKKTNWIGWNVANVVIPQGTSLPFNAFTADYYDKLSDAVAPSVDDGVEFPDMTSYWETNERVLVEIYSLVKGL